MVRFECNMEGTLSAHLKPVTASSVPPSLSPSELGKHCYPAARYTRHVKKRCPCAGAPKKKKKKRDGFDLLDHAEKSIISPGIASKIDVLLSFLSSRSDNDEMSSLGCR